MADMSDKTVEQILAELVEMVRTLPAEFKPIGERETITIILPMEQYWSLRGWPMIPALDLWRLDLPPGKDGAA